MPSKQWRKINNDKLSTARRNRWNTEEVMESGQDVDHATEATREGNSIHLADAGSIVDQTDEPVNALLGRPSSGVAFMQSEGRMAEASGGNHFLVHVRNDGSTGDIETFTTPSRIHKTLELSSTKPKKASSAVTGRRFWSMKGVENLISKSVEHGKVCSDSTLRIVSEQRKGLMSSFLMRCDACGRGFLVRNDAGDCTEPPNMAAVWAGNATGGGFTSMQCAFSAMDVPFMSATSYRKHEQRLHVQVEDVATDVLIHNGQEERQKAIELGRFHPDGVVWTEVQGDASWAKRSYNQKGTSLSGSAVIFGLLTNKPLFIGVRNKFCIICNKHGSENPPEHNCFKNWDRSSSEMEADIISHGFKESLSMHNMRYKRYLGDGDSSVFSNIQYAYFTGDNHYAVVEKIECKNHALRCLNKKLRELLTQTAYPIAHRKILEEKLNSIGFACCCVIQNSKDAVPRTPVFQLRQALENVLEHTFGNHEMCPAFCCNTGSLIIPECYSGRERIASVKATANDNRKLLSILRGSALWNAMTKALQRLVDMSKSLILGRTTNKSENFQAQFAKFLQGKRLNVSQRGSYNRKAYQTVLANQYGKGWVGPTYKLCTGKSPSALWKKAYSDGMKSRQRTAFKRRRRHKFHVSQKANKPAYFSKNAEYNDPNYGLTCNRPDLEDSELTQKLQNLINTRRVSNREEQWSIHLSTVGQFENAVYVERRKNMLTASICGKVFSLRDSTPNVETLDMILYPRFQGNAATLWGKSHEKVAIKLYEKLTNTCVEPAGLFVSLENPMLGASPDGLVGQDGILEVKCPFVERFADPSTVTARKGAFLCFTKCSTPQLKLKTGHHYYLQVVMQLHITGRKWCDFVAWTQGPVNTDTNEPELPEGQLFVERVFRDDETEETWTKVKEKLERFFMLDLGPELVDSRIDRSMGYRQPLYRAEAIAAAKDRIKAIPKKRVPLSPSRSQPKARRKLEF